MQEAAFCVCASGVRDDLSHEVHVSSSLSSHLHRLALEWLEIT